MQLINSPLKEVQQICQAFQISFVDSTIHYFVHVRKVDHSHIGAEWTLIVTCSMRQLEGEGIKGTYHHRRTAGSWNRSESWSVSPSTLSGFPFDRWSNQRHPVAVVRFLASHLLMHSSGKKGKETEQKWMTYQWERMNQAQSLSLCGQQWNCNRRATKLARPPKKLNIIVNQEGRIPCYCWRFALPQCAIHTMPSWWPCPSKSWNSFWSCSHSRLANKQSCEGANICNAPAVRVPIFTSIMQGLLFP